MGIVKFRKGKVAKYTARIGYKDKDGRTKLIITFVLTFNYIISTRLIFSVSSATSLAAGHLTEMCTGLGKRWVPRLCELAHGGQRESGGGIHAT